VGPICRDGCTDEEAEAGWRDVKKRFRDMVDAPDAKIGTISAAELDELEESLDSVEIKLIYNLHAVGLSQVTLWLDGVWALQAGAPAAPWVRHLSACGVRNPSLPHTNPLRVAPMLASCFARPSLSRPRV
jgi:hypothetical protein